VQMQLPIGACCGRCIDTAEDVIRDHQQADYPVAPSQRVGEPALA
jgi:bacterioferritin-associated ferredoxin